MTRNQKTKIRRLALAAFAILALSIRTAVAGPPVQTEGLWVANGDYISEFQGSALETSGTPDARLAFGIKAPFRVPYSIAFDSRNDLWITDLGGLRAGDVAIIEVLHHEIRSIKSGNIAPRRLVIPSGHGVATRDWFGFGLDPAGDLFVTAMSQLLGIPPHQLERHRPLPAVVIPSTQKSLQAMRFDASDNLWVSASDQLWRFEPSDRAVGGPLNPSLIVNLPANFGVGDIAVDSSGNLWLAGGDFTLGLVNEIRMISAADLGGSGQITPPIQVTITSSAFGVEPGLPGGICLGGIDFDHSSNLWISVHCDPEPHLIEFTPSQLSIGGDLTPSITISPNASKTNIAFPGPIRFGPTVN
jgi:hypothetical protein